MQLSQPKNPENPVHPVEKIENCIILKVFLILR